MYSSGAGFLSPAGGPLQAGISPGYSEAGEAVPGWYGGTAQLEYHGHQSAYPVMSVMSFPDTATFSGTTITLDSFLLALRRSDMFFNN